MTATLEQFNPRSLYDVYAVAIAIREKLCGGKPKSDALLEAHIIRQTGHEDEATKKLIAQAKEGATPEEGDLENRVEQSSTRFLSDERGLYIDAYQVKAMLRQSGSMLGLYKKRIGTKQICAEGLEVKGLEHERRVYLGKSAPDGTYEATIHVTGPKGKLSGIKRVDFVEGVGLAFEIWILKTDANEKRHVGEKDLVEILRFSQENGVGADRSQGYGKFDVVKFAKL